MNPYDKAFKISVTLHICVAALLGFAVLWNEIFRPRPAAIFTVMAPPAGLIAGGPMNSPMPSPEAIEAQQGPKMPSPAPAPMPQPSKSKPVNHEKPTPISNVIPTDDFLDSTPPTPKTAKSKTSTKTIKKEAKPQKISYAEWAKEHPQKATKTKASHAQATAVPAAAPSFEQNLASRLDRRIQEEGQETPGVGLGGTPGSGTMGSGTPGATEDADALYAGTLYSYLNSVWEEPKEVGNVHLYASVDFTVNKSGTITSWKISKGSGSEAFDKSVSRVFKQIRQVATPPTPQEYRLSVTFETRDS
jgi:TonB family protein